MMRRWLPVHPSPSLQVSLGFLLGTVVAVVVVEESLAQGDAAIRGLGWGVWCCQATLTTLAVYRGEVRPFNTLPLLYKPLIAVYNYYL